MRDNLTSGQLEALQLANQGLKTLMWRFFVRFNVLDLNGNAAPMAFWGPDVGNVELSGVTYFGGNLIGLSTLSAESNYSIPRLQILLSGVAAEAETLVRGRRIDQRPVAVDIGLFDVDNHALIGSPFRFFRGKIDDVDANTPQAGGESIKSITARSTSRALTRRIYELRSDAAQQERAPGDLFYEFSGRQQEKQIWFGMNRPGGTGSASGHPFFGGEQ